MKRIICMLGIILFILCGCTQSNQSDQSSQTGKINQIDTVSFSYTEDYETYGNGVGVKKSGFVNTKPSELKTAEQAVDLAKKECTVEYDTISVAYDSDLKIYRISFSKEGWVGGDQNVYINLDGITKLIVYGE